MTKEEELTVRCTMAETTAKELNEALENLLELGRKDTSNHKYDGYYQVAKRAIKKFKDLYD